MPFGNRVCAFVGVFKPNFALKARCSITVRATCVGSIPCASNFVASAISGSEKPAFFNA